ncbi:hypothetical protein [Granulibacter bethesdensis]|uniref:hypothetical protein n=1 Tax=Granulibacter bethesdensis TaxID=364410 RepID=UPI0003F1F082|nr:hypothetical protein [Granulibacter bethesdensis]AHJ68317.1 Hypothetical protein GbCGDNIH2_1842 [Granulibacter bethesdensis]
MSRKTILIAAPLIIAAVGTGGYWWMHQKVENRLLMELQAFQNRLRPDGSMTYSSAEPALWQRGVILHDVTLRYQTHLIKARTVSAHDVSGNTTHAVSGNTIGQLDLEDVTETEPEERATATARHVTVKALTIPDKGEEEAMAPEKLRFDRLDMAEWAVVFLPHPPKANDEDAEGKERPVQARFETFTIDHWGMGQTSDLRFTGLDALIPQASQTAHLTVRQSALTGADLAALIEDARHGRPRSSLGQNVVFETSGIKLEQSSTAFSCGHARSRETHSAAGDVETDVAVEDLTIPSVQETIAPLTHTDILRQLGYTSLSGSFAMQSHYTAGNQTWRLRSLRADVQKAGTLTISGALVGLPPAALDTGGPLAFLQARLSTLSLTWNEAGLMKNIVTMISRQRQATPEQVQQATLQQMDMLSQSAPAKIMPALDAVKAFLRDPRFLSLSATMDPPAPLLSLLNPNDSLLSGMTISATADPVIK